MSDAAVLLSLLYAGPGSAVCRDGDGRLVVRTPPLPDDGVVLTQEELLERGMDALLDLVA